ncbi:MAG TPA: methyltransferase domain-containing protein, partial [archaeon]|nr:methyltransferase domain-containing protein [archaeon]
MGNKFVRAYNMANGERGTYDPAERAEKEKIPESEILRHWETRAQRPDFQSVMSARHTLNENKEATAKLQEDIFDFLGGLVNSRVFELGIGIGRMTYQLAQRAREVVGIDVSPRMLERARENLNGFENIKLYVGKITDLDF